MDCFAGFHELYDVTGDTNQVHYLTEHKKCNCKSHIHLIKFYFKDWHIPENISVWLIKKSITYQ